MKIYWKILLMAVSNLPVMAEAQKGWQTGIKGGISIPSLRAPKGMGSTYSQGFQTVVGPQFGIVGEYRFNNFFSLQTELNYSTQGGEKNGEQRIQTSDFRAYIPAGVNLPNYLYSNFGNKISLVYLELPVLAKFSFPLASQYRLSFFGGPYVGYLLRADAKASGKNKIFTDPAKTAELAYNGFALGEVDFNRTEDIISQLNRTNFGIQGGSSIAYETTVLNYFFTIGGTYGFNRLQKDPNFGNNKTGSLIINIGVTRNL